jgi:hypothetical protein
MTMLVNEHTQIECLPCIYDRRQAFLAYIGCPWESVVSLSLKDAGSQPKRVLGKLMVQMLLGL